MDTPKVAVLSLTRDRLDYTKHCFQTLRDNAGIPYDHFVLDQASEDGTGDWLCDNIGDFKFVVWSNTNLGISRALNVLLDEAPGYDVYVKFDNDCELTTPDTLKVACELVHEHDDWILSPRILGLNSPPPVVSELNLDGLRVGVVPIIGGIFMAVPGHVFQSGYRHNEDNPTWGMDDAHLGSWFSNQGGHLGYLLDYPANHYETTEGQKRTYPNYWARKKSEMGLA